MRTSYKHFSLYDERDRMSWIQSVKNSFCKIPVNSFKTSRERVMYVAYMHGSISVWQQCCHQHCPKCYSSSPLDGRGLDLKRQFLCCFWTWREKNRIVQTGGVKNVWGGLMFWRCHWCAGTWGGRARLVMGHGKIQSRHQRSRNCGCRGSWGNTALMGCTGPDTPARKESH